MAGDADFQIVGLDAFARRLDAMGEQAAQAGAQAMREEAELIMTDSKMNYVPVDLGTLRSSGHVTPVTRRGDVFEVTLGFGGAAAAYAWSVHENPRAGQTGGTSPTGRRYAHWAKVGGWKYLETPFLKASPQVLQNIATSVRQIMARGS